MNGFIEINTCDKEFNLSPFLFLLEVGSWARFSCYI